MRSSHEATTVARIKLQFANNIVTDGNFMPGDYCYAIFGE